MSESICRFQFNIARWHIVCNKQLSEADWQQGAAHWQQNRDNFPDFAPSLAFLPPLKRRRLSGFARLFFEAAWDLVGDQPNIPVVYASSNSEMNRNFALWHSLLREGDISPTSFSLSVHNALIGQWSELRQVKAETTSLTAQQDNLEIALLEAYVLLQEGAKQVLVVVAESPLEAQYNAQPVQRQPFDYALAMLVEAGDQYQLTLNAQPAAVTASADNALQWVQHQYQRTAQWQTSNSTSGSWLWQKR